MRIDHYIVVDDVGLAAALEPLGGVKVDIPDASTSDGVRFHAGVNDLTSATALDYTEEASLSEVDHAMRQETLLRAIVDKGLAARHLLSDPVSGLRHPQRLYRSAQRRQRLLQLAVAVAGDAPEPARGRLKHVHHGASPGWSPARAAERKIVECGQE